ncbi:MAG TPA: STAS domain-containing protein [Candidatus Sumerlaeota bacterium]|jgi:anti-sigma B factor antagonist|nr:MAG: Anti-sigma-B factor antagonist [candidate division BRC1 bacterium ADurb.Bin183]HOE62799.1 STAS domain-containing protein [Candidatus Sumerlaeota bacterium]HRR29673.1 STAS domain-containing protein [Candidatus Sumerlaeia bacterium]HON50342.1 STAS domain-containing protein [Candidatus Sumerlaeota bacterium]HOR63558.1 STAS domain-containing protein [Candidatus Sumerlaeota bacterium]
MKSFDLHVRVEITNQRYTIIELTGFLDAHTVNAFENRIEEIVSSGQRQIVIDLKGLNYISSAGIGALMALTQRLRKESGNMVLLQPNEKVFKILDLLGFTKIFNVALKEEDVENYFQAV